MVNRSWMTRRCAAANSCGVWNEGEDKREEERLPGEAASSWQPRLGARAAAAFQSQMSLINSSASQFIPILGDQTRKGELQKFEEAWGAFTLDTYPIWSSTHAGIFFFSTFYFCFFFFFFLFSTSDMPAHGLLQLKGTFQCISRRSEYLWNSYTRILK